MAPDQRPEGPRLVANPSESKLFGDDEAEDPDILGLRSERRLGGAFDEEDQDEAEKPRRKLLPVLVSLLALIVFAGVIWYAYNWGLGDVEETELPVIQADRTPIKTKPENPGGLEVPHQDKLVLNELSPDPEKPQAERLLPPPETPKPPEIAKPAAALGDSSSTTVADAAKAASEEAPAGVETLLPPPPSAAAPVAGAEKPKTATLPGDTASPAETKAPAEKTAAEIAIPEKPKSTVPAVTGDFVVQLASLQSKEGPPALWAGLQKKFPDLLADRVLNVQTIDLGSRGTFYRVRAGFFSDRAGADALCNQLKARKQDCLVTSAKAQ